MLTIVVADTKPFRSSRIGDVMKQHSGGEVIIIDDTLATIADLEQYLYPSLFTFGTPIVHMRFMLEAREKDLTPTLVKKLLASPTMFLFEELSLSKSLLTSMKKLGADIHEQASTSNASAKSNLFGVTSLITMRNKKDRWLAYQQAISHYPIEAILGMLYWKIRDMAIKEKDSQGTYHTLYTAMLVAHAQAWQQGTPLALAIEKVLLTH